MAQVNTRKMFHVEPDRRYQRTATIQNELSLRDGVPGVADTLRYMTAAVDKYKTDPKIRELALSLTRGLRQKDYLSEFRALFDYVKNRIRYVRDINGVETLQTPLKTLEYGAGDCDDKSMLLATLLESLGHKTRFKAIGMQPGSLSHVSAQVLVNGQWLNLETTEPVNLGWMPPYYAEELNSDNLGGLFSKLWKGVKNTFHRIDVVTNKIDPLKKPVTHAAGKAAASKIGQAVGSVLAVIPATSYIGIAIKVAGTVQNVHTAEVASKKIQQTIRAKQLNDRAALAQLQNTRYVYDQSTQQVREATATDVGQQQFVLDTNSGQLVPANGAQISATTPGVTIGQSTAYPLPYASGGYTAPAGTPQVVFNQPGGGLTTQKQLADTQAAATALSTPVKVGLTVVGGFLLWKLLQKTKK